MNVSTPKHLRTRYQMIMLDPPWPETGGGGRGAKYPTIKKKEAILDVIMDSGVFLPHDNCHMVLWYTNNYLPWALWLMTNLGFSYKTQVTWTKRSRGTGYYFAGQTEHFLFGVRGTLAPREKMKFTTLLDVKDDPSAYANAHSRKPVEQYDVAESIGYGPRLEMFSRNMRPGWDSCGKDPALDAYLAQGKDEQGGTTGNNEESRGTVKNHEDNHYSLGPGCVLRTSASGLTEVVRVS